MRNLKKLIILLAIGTLLHFQLPLVASADAKPGKITENKPHFAGTAEEFLPGAQSGGGKPFNKRYIWVAAGAATVLALVVGASSLGGGGGGSSSGDGGNKPPENRDPGGVEVEW